MGMLACFNDQTMHLFQGKNPYADQIRLRYRAFRKFNWDAVHYLDHLELEYDDYDFVPDPTYLVFYGDNDVPLGSARLLRTDRPFLHNGKIRTFMLRDAFNDIVDDMPAPGPNVLEGTRFVIAPELLPLPNGEDPRKKVRRRIISEITLGIFEFCQSKGVDTIVGLMLPKIWESIWGKRGCSPEFIGPAASLVETHETVRAGKLHVSDESIEKMRVSTGLLRSSLFFGSSATKPSFRETEIQVPRHAAA